MERLDGETLRSRVHMALYYPPLDMVATKQIFRVNMERIRRYFADRHNGSTDMLRIDEKEIIQFAEAFYLQQTDSRWNGRQISDAFDTALALAEKEVSNVETEEQPPTTTLSAKHFERLAEGHYQFTG